jgi:NADH:ubiquinone oxidoreductase subunit 5 (subunit L)/multisubunit Na+/H+ antiporter MnhA subunit
MFKSLLFLCAGVFIHSYGEIEDIRFISRLLKGLPVSSLYFIICSIALCGFPFLSGFYSKDLILEVFIIGEINFVFYVVRILATIFTLSYSIRLS